MNSIKPFLMAAGISFAATGLAQAAVVDDLLNEYRSQGAGTFNADSAAEMWTREFTDAKTGKPRSCASCHTKNLSASGKHVKTGKSIDPLAPSANRERLTDAKKIRKWLKRNCKWTLGRECSAQEKGDFLSYIRGL